MGLDLLEKLTDPYERKARIYPILLALSPFAGICIGLYSFQIDKQWIGVLVTFGVFYLLASLSRKRGKNLEEGLFKSWGGKPTTQLLRHRDQTLDPVTKSRYHSFLSRQINVSFPSYSDESLDPISADQVYTSAVKWLLEQTRDTKTHHLIFKENIEYGFYRNCLGCKPLGVAAAILSTIWILVFGNVITARGFILSAITSIPNSALGALGITLTILSVWLLLITKTNVRTAAFTYAETLLRACDVLDKKNKSTKA